MEKKPGFQKFSNKSQNLMKRYFEMLSTRLNFARLFYLFQLFCPAFQVYFGESFTGFRKIDSKIRT